MDHTKGNTLLGMLLFGSLWGAAEATLGITLHLMNHPYKGAIMMSIGMLMMTTAIRAYKPKNIMKYALGIGVIASFLKGFDILVVGPDMMVIRPMITIIIEALAFGTVYRILQTHRITEILKMPASGIGYAYLSYIIFGLMFTYLGLGSTFWLNKTLEELLNMVLSDGSIAAFLSAITALAGDRIGQTFKIIQKKPFYYQLMAAVVLGSWALGIGFS